MQQIKRLMLKFIQILLQKVIFNQQQYLQHDLWNFYDSILKYKIAQIITKSTSLY